MNYFNRNIIVLKGKIFKQHENNFDYFSLALLVICIFVTFAMCAMVVPQFHNLKTDDGNYYNLAHTQSFGHYLYGLYIYWSGRISSNIALYLSAWTGVWMYRILTPLFMLLAAYSIARYFTARMNLRYLLFAYLSFGLMNQLILGGAVFWWTGSYNYIFPISLALFAMIPYADSYFRGINQPSRTLFLLSATAGIIGVLGSEQTAAVVVGFIIIFHINKLIKKERLSALFYIYTLLLIIATLILIFAPGNAARAKTDYQYIEGFASLPIAGHIKLVLFLLFDGIVNVMPLLVITLSCIPLLFNNKFTGRLRYLYLLFVPQFVFAMCAKLFSKVFVSKTSIEFLFNFSNLFTDYNKDLSFLLQNMTPGTIFNQFGAYIFWSIYLVLMVVLISYLYEKPIFIMLSFLAGFATIFLLINSGTMFASSNRVFFPCSIFLLIIINAFTIKSKLIWENSFMLGFSMICFINYGTLIAYWMQEGYKIVV